MQLTRRIRIIHLMDEEDPALQDGVAVELEWGEDIFKIERDYPHMWIYLVRRW